MGQQHHQLSLLSQDTNDSGQQLQQLQETESTSQFDPSKHSFSQEELQVNPVRSKTKNDPCLTTKKMLDTGSGEKRTIWRPNGRANHAAIAIIKSPNGRRSLRMRISHSRIGSTKLDPKYWMLKKSSNTIKSCVAIPKSINRPIKQCTACDYDHVILPATY